MPGFGVPGGGDRFRIYANDGLGGPINFTTPVATVTGTSWTTPTLLPNGVYRYCVRTFDTVTGLEDDNADAIVEIRLDASGYDVSGVPSPAFAISARATASGGAQVSWAWLPRPNEANPTGFRVWLTAGVTVNYAAAPTATVAFVAGRRAYGAALTGLVAGTTYSIGVRAYNAAGDEPNTERAELVGLASPPGTVSGLAGSGA
jgi:hypothetical protein